MAQEVRGVTQGTAGGRAEEWKMPEPPGEDQPEPSVRPEIDSAQERLSRLGRYIGRSALPGDREALRRSAQDLEAPDDILGALDRLPEGQIFHTVVEIWNDLNPKENVSR
jgi:hypothetical protein